MARIVGRDEPFLDLFRASLSSEWHIGGWKEGILDDSCSVKFELLSLIGWIFAFDDFCHASVLVLRIVHLSCIILRFIHLIDFLNGLASLEFLVSLLDLFKLFLGIFDLLLSFKLQFLFQEDLLSEGISVSDQIILLLEFHVKVVQV